LLQEFQHNQGSTKVRGCWLLEEFQHNQGSTKVRGCRLLEEFQHNPGSIKVGETSNTNNHGFKYLAIKNMGYLFDSSIYHILWSACMLNRSSLLLRM
jgi:hypothetical protein